MAKSEKVETLYNKTYAQIWDWFVYKHVGQGRLSEYEAKQIHLKWKRIAAEVK